MKTGGRMKANVYYTTMKIVHQESLLDKLENLLRKAGLEKIDFQEKFVAIKIHFGEPGNLAYLRPNYAMRVVNLIKRLGGKPFLTDCNTLYVGRRKNGLEHLEAAYENGYNPFQTGCQTIIADGIKGTDSAEVAVDLEYVRKARIGRALADSDIIISMTHFKGHMLAGFGGTLKNLGMGGASREGKMQLHSGGKPFVREEKCRVCRMCAANCAQDAISILSKAKIDPVVCVGCGRCLSVCPFDAIGIDWEMGSGEMNRKVAEYAYAVVRGKPHFHTSFIIDVSPDCDCDATNDQPIVANLGFLASFDPVALDQAAADLVNQAPLLHYPKRDQDHFRSLHPHTSWEDGLDQGEKIGLGTRDYHLITLD
jgi:uncharacterized Fe-S center protein